VGNHPVGRRSTGGRGAGGAPGARGDHPAGGGVGRGQGRADLLVRVPGPGSSAGGGRRSGPTRRCLAGCWSWPSGGGSWVPRVVMEATSGAWKGVSSTCWKRTGSRAWLVHAGDARAPPGTAKTDTWRRSGGASWPSGSGCGCGCGCGFVPTADPAAAAGGPRPGGSGGGPGPPRRSRVEQLPGGCPDQPVGGRL